MTGRWFAGIEASHTLSRRVAEPSLFPLAPRLKVLGTFSLEAELLLQSDERALECTQDRAAEQRAVEQAWDRAAGLVLDGQPVDESVTVRLEVALVVRVG